MKRWQIAEFVVLAAVWGIAGSAAAEDDRDVGPCACEATDKSPFFHEAAHGACCRKLTEAKKSTTQAIESLIDFGKAVAEIVAFEDKAPAKEAAVQVVDSNEPADIDIELDTDLLAKGPIAIEMEGGETFCLLQLSENGTILVKMYTDEARMLAEAKSVPTRITTTTAAKFPNADAEAMDLKQWLAADGFQHLKIFESDICRQGDCPHDDQLASGEPSAEWWEAIWEKAGVGSSECCPKCQRPNSTAAASKTVEPKRLAIEDRLIQRTSNTEPRRFPLSDRNATKMTHETAKPAIVKAMNFSSKMSRVEWSNISSRKVSCHLQGASHEELALFFHQATGMSVRLELPEDVAAIDDVGIHVQCRDKTVAEALEVTLGSCGLGYVVLDGAIVITSPARVRDEVASPSGDLEGSWSPF